MEDTTNNDCLSTPDAFKIYDEVHESINKQNNDNKNKSPEKTEKVEEEGEVVVIDDDDVHESSSLVAEAKCVKESVPVPRVVTVQQSVIESQEEIIELQRKVIELLHANSTEKPEVVDDSKKVEELEQRVINLASLLEEERAGSWKRVLELTNQLVEERKRFIMKIDELTSKVAQYEMQPQHHSIRKPSQIIVKNVPSKASYAEVESLFASFNGFVKLDMPMNLDDSHTGFGFACFVANREAARAFRAIVKPIYVHGSKLSLEYMGLTGA